MFRDTKRCGDGFVRRVRVLGLGAIVLFGLWAGWQCRAGAAEQSVEEARSSGAGPSAMDLTRLPADAVAVRVVRPGAIWKRPEFKPYRRLVNETVRLATGLEIGLQKLDQVTCMVLAPRENEGEGDPDPADLIVLVLQAGKPHDFTGLVQRWIEGATKEVHEGQAYFAGKYDERSVAYYRPDERTAVFGSEDAVCRVIAAPKGQLPEFLSEEVVAQFEDDHVFVAGWSAVIDFILKSPELALVRTVMAPFSPAWKKTNWFAFGLRFDDRLRKHVVLFGKDEEGAKRVEETIQAQMVLHRNRADGLREPFEGAPAWLRSLQATVVDVLDDAAENTRVERSGKVVRVKTWTDASILVGKRDAHHSGSGDGD